MFFFEAECSWLLLLQIDDIYIYYCTVVCIFLFTRLPFFNAGVCSWFLQIVVYIYYCSIVGIILSTYLSFMPVFVVILNSTITCKQVCLLQCFVFVRILGHALKRNMKKYISLVIPSYQISGKNSESKYNCREQVSQKSVCQNWR